MHQVVLALGFGLVTAAILALSAVGFSLQFGVSNIFNLAYGAVMTVGAFAAYLVNGVGHGNIWLGMAAGGLAGAGLSVAMNSLVFRPFLRRGTALFAMVMVSLALATILQNGILAIVGPRYRGYRVSPETSLHVFGMLLTARQLTVIAVALVSMSALHVMLRYSRIGRAMRASAANADLARSCGVPTERVTSLAWAVSGVLCGVSGVALALNLASFNFTVGSSFLLVVVASAVFGSVGQPYGAMAGAVVIGIGGEMAAIVSPALKQVVAFVLLAVILLVRPNGLWPRTYVQKLEMSAR